MSVSDDTLPCAPTGQQPHVFQLRKDDLRNQLFVLPLHIAVVGELLFALIPATVTVPLDNMIYSLFCQLNR